MTEGRGMKDPVDALERAMGDQSEWETPTRSTRRKSERRQRGAVVSVRLTPSELETIQQRASALGLSVGAFMRREALGGPGNPFDRSGFGGGVLYSVTAATFPASGSYSHAEVPQAFQRWESSADSLVDH